MIVKEPDGEDVPLGDIDVRIDEERQMAHTSAIDSMLSLA